MVSATDNFRPKDKKSKTDSTPSPTSPIVFLGLISLLLIGFIFLGNFLSKGKLFSKLKSNLKEKTASSDSNDESVTSEESPSTETKE